MMDRSSGKMSWAQKNQIIEFLEDNPKLKGGKFDNSFTSKNATELWQKLAEILNSIPGAKKDWKSWRKSWHYLKCVVKSKSAAAKKHLYGTGGGPSAKLFLTSEELRVQQLINPNEVSGHEDVLETEIEMDIGESTTPVFNNEYPRPTTSYPESSTIVIEASDPPDNMDYQKVLKENRLPLNGRRGKNAQRCPKRRSVETAQEICSAAAEKTKLKKEYYKKKMDIQEKKTRITGKKLSIMERDTLAREEIAQALTKISMSFV